LRELKLPVALERVLAFKDARVSQVGVKPEDLERVVKGSNCHTFVCYVCDNRSLKSAY